MLYNFLYPLSQNHSIFNLFRYLTFRTGGALMTSLILSFLIGPAIIRRLKVMQKKGQPIREDGPESHLLKKKGTPTMGGIMILICITFSTIVWADITNQYVWAVLTITLIYGVIGFIDDYLKVVRNNPKGLRARTKFLLQVIFAGLVMYWINTQSTNELKNILTFPFFKNIILQLGIIYSILGVFVMVGSSNAVNLTDGLDGLAIVPMMIAAAVFMIIAYLAGNVVFANYLQIHYTQGSGELAVLCGAMVGAAMGFLWFNAPPALVFMGDTGSLAIGGALGAISIITKHELVLAIVGGLFVLETISVIIQVAYFKLTGKRIFRMAPIHHHFEKMGWAESTVVIRFWIVAMILGIIGLSTLKLR